MRVFAIEAMPLARKRPLLLSIEEPGSKSVLSSASKGPGRTRTNPPEGSTTLKHITPTHFTWVTYAADGTIARTAGGTYTVAGDTYQEDPEYGVGADFGVINRRAQKFTCKVDGDRWSHTGALSKATKGFAVQASSIAISLDVALPRALEQPGDLAISARSVSTKAGSMARSASRSEKLNICRSASERGGPSAAAWATIVLTKKRLACPCDENPRCIGDDRRGSHIAVLLANKSAVRREDESLHLALHPLFGHPHCLVKSQSLASISLPVKKWIDDRIPQNGRWHPKHEHRNAQFRRCIWGPDTP